MKTELIVRKIALRHSRCLALRPSNSRHLLKIALNGVASENGKNRTLRVCKRLQQPDLTSFIASSSARHNPSQIDRFLTLLENGRF